MLEAASMSRPRREDQPSRPCLCSHHLNLEGQIAMEGVIPQELLKLPVLTRYFPAEKPVDLAVKLGW